MRLRRGRIVAVVVLGLVAVWVAAVLVRSGGVARDYFASAHGTGSAATNVTIDGSGPAVPPFWSVTISGDVTEPGGTAPAYRSSMILWVEPVSGLVIVQASG